LAKKLFYKIGEACKFLDIQPYVLRYWETEFPVLNPGKSRTGQRVYSDKEIEVIRRIKVLLYEEGYTIAGAKKRLDQELPELMADGDGEAASPVSANPVAASPAAAPAEPPAADGPRLRPAERLAAAMRAAKAASTPVNATAPSVVVTAPSAAAAPGADDRPADLDRMAAPLDTLAHEKIETLRTGISRALEDAKALLAVIDRHAGAASTP
jgi:DNA-binding transcriptional MerR regulator